MRQRTLVTGFLPFGGHRVNPSALLAQSCGRPFELLEVSFAAADSFLARLTSRVDSFDCLLMLGLRGDGTAIEFERLARNHVGAEPDVRGEARGPGPIDPAGPETLTVTLFDSDPAVPASSSDDAGCYLCNYVYYRALQALPEKRVGFVHVPPPEVMRPDAQGKIIAALLDATERGRPAGRPPTGPRSSASRSAG